LRGQSQKLIQNAGDATAQIAQNALVEERAKLKHKNAAFAWLKADSKRTQNQTCELLEKGLLLGCESINVLLKKGDPSQFCVKKKNAKQFTMRKTNLKFCNNSSRWVASRRMSVFFPPVDANRRKTAGLNSNSKTMSVHPSFRKTLCRRC